MRRVPLVCGSLAALTVAGLIVACDNPNSTNPTSPSAPRIVGVELVGPDTIAPGAAAQYRADVRLSDGSRKAAAPGSSVWSFDSQFIRVDASGVATTQQRLGDTTLRVTVQGSPIVSSKEITIVPEGTFRVIGRVVDAEFPSTPVPSARVQAIPGEIETTTDVRGDYRLYGVPANVTIRASQQGYLDVEHRLQLAAHGTQDFRMPASGERLTLSGDYTLEIDASSCTGFRPLPASLRVRQYDAVLTQNGNNVDVFLPGSRFKTNSIGRGNRFNGQITGPRATFRLDFFQWYYYSFYIPFGYPNVAEQLPDGSILVPEGTVLVAGFIGSGIGGDGEL